LGGCAWCGAELPPRRRTWCSDRCGTAFWNNHWWSQARREAKRRDKYRCRRCGHVAPKRPARVRFPTETAYRAAMRAWRAGKPLNRLEVNHRVPALGAHRMLSCVHHLDNLETLCVNCHKETTSAMRPRRGAREPAAPGPGNLEHS
jgi:DNA-directed RNA polymerase subunit RPC12/RpoP